MADWCTQIHLSPVWQYMVVLLGHLTGAWGRRTIILLSSYRFGSSLMMNYLNVQPNIRRRGEILNPDEVVYGNFEQALQKRVLLHIKAMCFAPPGWVRVAKLMDSQIEQHSLTLDDVITALEQPYIVAVYRRDLLSAYVSLRIAQENGIWYSTDTVNDVRMSIDFTALKNYVHVTRQRWLDNAAKLRSYNRAILVAYEDFSEYPDRVMDDVFHFLGFPCKGPVTETIRQNPAPLSHKIRNYDELGLPKLVQQGYFTLDLG